MPVTSSIFDRIRIKPPKAEPATRSCDHPGCKKGGAFRAPQGRNREGKFFFFCMDHVKEYNASYNYFNGMSDAAVQAFQKDAITGHRPTWSIGINGGEGKGGLGGHDAPNGTTGDFARAKTVPEPARRVSAGALKALDTLGLDENADRAAVRTQFKALAKRFHPDLNGGDRSCEDRLRSIIDAYNYLKSAGYA